ncbi:MAG: hypothetical protein DRR42_11665 [Gammaproteobacteria bacterium]|nr:MAG: hypothetical protein DRR42_11665 [Gammaproteobacteria bacterium]
MLIITFSGLDGCGKSTHVSRTAKYLQCKGQKVLPLRTVSLSVTGLILILREGLQKVGISLFKQPTTIAPSGAEIRTYSKGHTFSEDQGKFIVIFKRWLAYPVDALLLRISFLYFKFNGYDALICDRYTYDKLVNLPDVNCRLSRFVLWLAPTPVISFFIDVDPEQARSRREEHDMTYYELKYASYSELVDLAWGLESLKPTTIDDTQRAIEERVESTVVSLR